MRNDYICTLIIAFGKSILPLSWATWIKNNNTNTPQWCGAMSVTAAGQGETDIRLQQEFSEQYKCTANQCTDMVNVCTSSIIFLWTHLSGHRVELS